VLLLQLLLLHLQLLHHVLLMLQQESSVLRIGERLR